MDNNDLIPIKYDRISDGRETDKAWCFIINNRIVFLPKSQVEDIRETENVVVIPFWLAKSKQLETYED